MPQGSLAARRQLLEELLEVRRHGSEDGVVASLLFGPQPADQVLEVGSRRGDVLQLGDQRLIALLELTALVLGQRVGRPDLFEAALERPHLPLPRLPAGHLLRRQPLGHAFAELIHPGLVERGVAGDQAQVAFERGDLEPGVDARFLEANQLAGARGQLSLLDG